MGIELIRMVEEMVNVVEHGYGSHKENDWGLGQPCLQECKLTNVSKTLPRFCLWCGSS